MRKLILWTFMLLALGTVKAQNELYIYQQGGVTDTLQMADVANISHSRTDLQGNRQSDYVLMAVQLTDNTLRQYQLSQLDSVVVLRGDVRFHLTRFIGNMRGNGSTTQKAPRRTSLDGDFMASTSDVDFFWETDDYISINEDGIGIKSSARLDFEGEEAVPTAEFVFDGVTLTEDNVTVYYAGQTPKAYNQVSVNKDQTQTLAGSTKHIGVSGDCGTAVAERQDDGSYTFALEHKASYLCFLPYIANNLERTVLKKITVRSGGGIAGEFMLSHDNGMVVKDETEPTHVITLTTDDFVLPQRANQSIAAYMVLAPQTTATRLTCEFTVYDLALESEGVYTKVIDLPSIAPNTVYVVKANCNNYVVDLGLPVKFLNHNYGAFAPEEYGGYYAWGELDEKGTYSNSASSYSLYNANVGRDIRLTDYDVAHVRMGGNFSMPNAAEMRMLVDSCTWTNRYLLNGVYGYKVTGKNGNNLFLPAVERRSDASATSNSNNTEGYYRTSTLSSSGTKEAWELYLRQQYDNRRMQLSSNLYMGYSVRPVISSGVQMTDGTLIQVTTDSLHWNVGESTAKLFGTVNGFKKRKMEVEEVGFVVGTVPGVTLADGTKLIASITDDGQYTKDFSTVEDQTVYYFRAYIKTANDSVYYAHSLQFGRKYVDLGLESGNLWSNINIGASSPGSDDYYYAWGETETKSTYTRDNSKWYKSSIYFFPEGLFDVQATRYDIAAQKWGEVWMLPNETDLMELYDNCDFSFSSLNGMPGFLATSKKNKESIFIALSGYNKTSDYTIGGRVAASSVKTDSRNRTYIRGYLSGNNYLTMNKTNNTDNRVNGYVVRPIYKTNATAKNGKPMYVRTLPVRRKYDGTLETDTLRGIVRGLDIAGDGNTYGIIYWKEVEDRDTEGTVIPLSASADGYFQTILSGLPAGTTYCYQAYIDNGSEKFYGETQYLTTVGVVDLGLSVNWANVNVGIEDEKTGVDFYRWGATKSMENIGTELTTYSDLTPDGGYDIAANMWGRSFRMPSQEEFEELLTNCEWEWTTRKGISGYLVTSKVAGYTDRSIFMPATGYYRYTGYYDYDYYHDYLNTQGHYWTSSVDTETKAYLLEIKNGTKEIKTDNKYNGSLVRAVQPKTPYVATTGCDWTIGAATASLQGYAVGADWGSGATYGIVVGNKPELDVTNSETVVVKIEADNINSKSRYSVDYTYDGSAKFFRAYVKVGDTYYQGEVKSVTAADLLDVELMADGTAFNGTFTDLPVAKYGSPNVTYNETYKRYQADFSNRFADTAGNYYSFYFNHNTDFKAKLEDGHSVEVLLKIPSTPNSDSESDAFASYENGGTGIGVYKKQIYTSFYMNGYKEVYSNTTPEANRYYHVVAVWNKEEKQISLYIDGELSNKYTYTSNWNYSQPNSSSAYYVVGGNPSNKNANYAWAGSVAIARIYDKPLTGEEVKILYDNLAK